MAAAGSKGPPVPHQFPQSPRFAAPVSVLGSDKAQRDSLTPGLCPSHLPGRHSQAKPSRTLTCPGHRNGTGAPGSYCQVQLPAGVCSSAWLKGLQIPVLLPAEPSRGAEPCLGTGSSSGLRGSSGCWALPFVLSR